MTQRTQRLEVDSLFRLDGRVALVTGAGGHLGSRIARALCASGAHVILNGRSRENVKALADELRQAGHSVSEAVYDITSDEQMEEMFEKVVRGRERLDILVNNASSGSPGTLETATLDDFESSYRVTVTAAFNIIMRSKPFLEAAGKRNACGSSVVNIATMYATVSPDPSLYGTSGQNNPPYYGAAKAGLIQLTRYAACHLAPSGIRVNSISPGPFPNPAVVTDDPAFAQRLCRKNPMNRIGYPDEICGPVLFFASDASSYVTGVNLPVDGGWTAW